MSQLNIDNGRMTRLGNALNTVAKKTTTFFWMAQPTVVNRSSQNSKS